MSYFSTNTTKTVRGVKSFLLLLLCVFLSVGAWWDLGRSTKKEKDREKAATTASVKRDQAQSNLAVTSEPEETEEITGEERIGVKKRTPQDELDLSPKKQQEEAAKIKADLDDIIERTRQLQARVQDDRSEIQKIMERAQIHERILRSISIPQPIPTKYQVNADEIVKQEKLRLIAEQARQTQEQLRIIQQAKSLGSSVRSAPTGTKTSNAS